MSIAKDNYLFQVLQELNSKHSNIKLISQSIMEDVLSRIIALIPRGERLDIIITFLKYIIMDKPKIKQLTKQNFKDSVKYLHKNYRNFNLTTEIQKKLNKIINSIELL
jgi:HKD family nuclease